MKYVVYIRMILLCLTGGGLCGALCAQSKNSYPQAQIDSLLNPSLMKQAACIVRFDRTVIDMGTLTEDDVPVTYRFAYTNVSNRPLVIARAVSTCSCVTTHFHTESLQPGKMQTIELTFHPKNHLGTIDTDVFVYLASEKAPVARLALIGSVLPGKDEWVRYPYAMGKLRLKQSTLTFAEVLPGRCSTERILCGNSGETPLQLTAPILPPYATFRTEPAVIPPGEEADIVVTIDASQIPAGAKEELTFPLIIEGVSTRPSDRTLNIKIKRIN